jgi:hypothetical protein
MTTFRIGHVVEIVSHPYNLGIPCIIVSVYQDGDYEVLALGCDLRTKTGYPIGTRAWVAKDSVIPFKVEPRRPSNAS